MDLSNEANFRKYMTEAREKAALQLESANVGAEFKEVIRMMLQITNATEELLNSGRGQSADARMLKVKLEQAKKDYFALKQSHDKLKKSVFSAFSEEIVAITTEVKNIARSAGEASESGQAAKRIQNTVKVLINKLAELTKIS